MNAADIPDTVHVLPFEKNQNGSVTAANFSARVIAVGDCFQVQTDDTTMNATKAFSCLLVPAADDLVMCSSDQHGNVFIVAILQRQEPEGAVISLPENSLIHSKAKVTLSADELHQISRKQLQSCQESITEFDQAIIKGNRLQASVHQLQVISDMVTSLARQVMQKFGSYVRRTEQVDEVQSAQMMRKCSGLYNMNSKHTIMVSEKDTRIDGEHIHMG